MIQGNICHDRKALQLLLTDQLPPERQAAVVSHLDGCTACQQTLEEMAAARPWWDELRQLPASVPCTGLATASAVHDATSRDFPAQGSALAEGISLDFLDPPQGPLELGRLGSFTIDAVIGRGGTGIVLRAQDPALNRPVAIKVLAPWFASSPAARQRFAREARAAAAVVHGHVVAVHGVDAWRGLPYLVMAYVRGRSLQDRLDSEGALPVEEVVRIGRQAAAGLAAAHEQGLVHRDIKPANILLEQETERVLLTDFGLARAADDASLTQSGVIAGTPQYMAPEQARGENVDNRADLFGLGSVLYAMCTGQSPFRADSPLAVLRRVCEEQPTPIRQINPQVPEWLVKVIERLHAKLPAQRFQTADEVAELLGTCHAHLRQPDRVALPGMLQARNGEVRTQPSRLRQTILALAALTTLGLAGASLRNYLPWVQQPIGSNGAQKAAAAPATNDEQPLQNSLNDLARRLAALEADIRQPARSRLENPLDKAVQEIRARLTALEQDLGDPTARK